MALWNYFYYDKCVHSCGTFSKNCLFISTFNTKFSCFSFKAKVTALT